MSTQANRRVVLKFGGTSVSSAQRWETIARVLKDRLEAGERPLLVHSALAGVTDLLERLPGAALEGEGGVLTEILGRHRALGVELGLDPSSVIQEEEAELERLAAGIRLLGEVNPRIRARVLSFGERMATRLGAAFLVQRGLPAVWWDARELLLAVPRAGNGPTAAYLSAECDAGSDPLLLDRFDALEGFPVTQGFVARNGAGETVVLGRGGSDTAAAYLAGKLDAVRLEIWTDVPGMFSADPRVVPTARLLRHLNYREAQEIATTGSRVLHPRCIPALRDRQIPIHLRSALDPERQGTVIGPTEDGPSARVKAVSRKTGVVLVSMETVGMWQEVGFLARAFDAFRTCGLSVDLVSTSETSVTVSLDADANLLDEGALLRLQEELSDFCRVRIIRPCAAVSLVGSRIRGLLHRLGPAMEAFQEHRIHMVTQAASDLNLTVVVDEDQADRLVPQLHALIISSQAPSDSFGPTWQQILEGDPPAPPRPPRWWEKRREELLAIGEREGAAYVYDAATVVHRLSQLHAIPALSRVLYAMKANPHPGILSLVRASGAGFECVSLGELERVLTLFPGIDRREILFTPNFAPREEYRAALELGVNLTLDALHPLTEWPELFADREILARIDPGWGSGHNEKVVTGGRHSKFGIPTFELEELRSRTHAVGARVVGLHTHSGSGILSPEHWPRVAALLAEVADRFPEARALDVGGGLGVPEKPGQAPLDLGEVARGLQRIREAHPGLELWMEPGRFVVAEAGVLLARVTQTKGKGEVRYVGLSTGMNSLLRPALYGAYHEIVNLSRLGEPSGELVQVVGPICETGDRLGTDRLLPPSREGDIILIATAGAYGHAMSSRYNLREPAVEIMLEG